jgi:hypothetical protein
MDYGTLRVTTPDGQVREYPIDVATVVVGRSDGNGVVIDHVSVSRRHAQLLLQSGDLVVEDLGSANGTFVGSQRLGANAPTKVEEGQAIRFGDVEAHFILPNSAAAAGAAAGQQAAGPADSQGTIGVSLASPASPVAVGQATTATVVVQNRGTTVDQLTISVIDLPAAWVRISRPTLSLVGGARDEVTIVIQPPRSSEATAGEHPFSVSVVSGDNGREVRVLGTCTILPFDAFSASLQSGGGGFKVLVENQGNSTMSYALSVTSEGETVTAKLERESLELGPGANAVVPLSVSPNGKPLFGSMQVRQFRVHVKPTRGALPEATSDGQVTVRPPLRHWKLPVAAIVILAALGLGGYGATQRCGSRTGFLGCFGSVESKISASQGSPTAPPSTPQPGSATAAPAAVLRNGATAVVVNSPAGDCLFVREYHTRRADDPRSKKLGELCNGKKVKITSDKVEEEGYVWWSIDDGAGLTGWAAERAVGTGDPWLVLSQ